MNSIQILDALKSKDLNSIKAFSEYAVREKQEAFIPVLIYCLNISTDSLIKRNLLRLMSLFNKKYLSHIEIFIQDEDQIVSELATEIVQSIKAMPKILEPKLNEDLDNTAANNLYNALNQDQIDSFYGIFNSYFGSNANIYLLGNGGSQANAHHISGDFIKTFSLSFTSNALNLSNRCTNFIPTFLKMSCALLDQEL